MSMSKCLLKSLPLFVLFMLGVSVTQGATITAEDVRTAHEKNFTPLDTNPNNNTTFYVYDANVQWDGSTPSTSFDIMVMSPDYRENRDGEVGRLVNEGTGGWFALVYTDEAALVGAPGDGVLEFWAYDEATDTVLKAEETVTYNQVYGGEIVSGEAGNVGTLTFTEVPEPTTMGLLAIGGLALLKRRRKK